MKKLTLMLVFIIISIGLFSQTQQAFKYQAIVRDNVGNIIANQEVSFRISIRDVSTAGTIIYQETHSVTTNDFGLANLEIGNGDPPITGTIADIDWGTNDKFLEVELDPLGNTAYVSMGTTQLLSVPYSLYSESTGDTSRWKKNNDNLYFNNGNVGIGTDTPDGSLDVRSTGTDEPAMFRLGNSDASHSLSLFPGRENDPNPFIQWKEGDPLRFSTDEGGWSEKMRIESDGNVGIGTENPEESALLDLNSNSKGMLIPRMSQARIEAITNPANGLQAFNTDDGILYIYILAENKWKEVQYGTGEIMPSVNFTIGTGGSCANTVVSGNYYEGDALDGSNTVTINALVTLPGYWSITTNTLNGYSFSGSGTFVATGWVQVTLYGSGTPLTAQTDNFTAMAYGNGGTCTFSVTVDTVNYTIGSGGSCANTTVNGNYYKGDALDGFNTVTIDASVTSLGYWSITTNTLNGYSFSGSGTFATTGTVQVTLYGSGTPLLTQTDNFTATANGIGGTCTFSVTVPTGNYTIGTGGSCANTTVNGNYYEGDALGGFNTVSLNASVTSPGYWSITTNTLNGYSFSGSGTFATTGTVQVTLYGSGTPITSQTDNFTATANGICGTCTFSVTVPTGNYTIGTGGSCANTTVNGNYHKGVALDGSNTVTIDASVTSPGYWSITTNISNGYSFSGSGTFATTGTVQLTLYGSGTPLLLTGTADNFTATANGICGTCTFLVTVENPPLVNYTIGTGGSCANTTINGSYYEGVALNGTNTVIIDAEVTTTGGYYIITDTVNGYHFGDVGTFATTGTVQVILYGSGTPITGQTDNFTVTAYGGNGTCTFSVAALPPCTSLVDDIDGNTYNVVQIGSQCWMAENLKTTTYRNGTPIPNVTDSISWENLTTGAYVWFDNYISWKGPYGALYNWYATVDTNGLCPTGWHVPTHDEWTTLTDFIGGTGSPHGNELKSCRQVNSPLGGGCNTTDHPRWSESSEYGTDDYGFSGLPGGSRSYDGSFNSIGNNGVWWSSTEYSSSNAWARYLNYNYGSVFVYNYNKQDGVSVRCLRDN